jgi:hypothetical protein
LDSLVDPKRNYRRRRQSPLLVQEQPPIIGVRASCQSVLFEPRISHRRKPSAVLSTNTPALGYTTSSQANQSPSAATACWAARLRALDQARAQKTAEELVVGLRRNRRRQALATHRTGVREPPRLRSRREAVSDAAGEPRCDLLNQPASYRRRRM